MWNKAHRILLFFSTLYCLYNFSSCVKYEPTWESFDSRPLPKWFDEAKIGIFIHWGVFSVPSFGSEWFWANWKSGSDEYVQYINDNFAPNFSYQEFARDFTAEFYNPDQWAELFEKSGAKYVVLTSKHHEGYALWPSKYSYSWNVKDVGPHRDLLGDLAEAVRKRNLTFGLYHSLYEWFHPLYLSDKESNFSRTEFVDYKMLPEMYELVETYKPSILWSDGDWEAYDTYFKSKTFLAWLYNESPVKDTVVVNDRWGKDIPCTHGDFFSCQDRFNPGVLQEHKWENAMTIDKTSWGFRRNAKLSEYLTTHDLIKTLIQTISCGGNILINVGPTKEGIIAPIFEERLLNLGEWLEINGEAIYNSTPWTAQNDTLTPDVWYTTRDSYVYATILNWPEHNILTLSSIANHMGSNSHITILGNSDDLEWTIGNNEVTITFPDKSSIKSQWAWVLKISN